jgi:F0F1-type ATP synthase membrane subunit b/b'
MRFDTHRLAAPVRPLRRSAWHRPLLAIVVVAGLLVFAPQVRGAATGTAAVAAPQEHAQPAGEGEPDEPEHESGALSTVAKVFNFAVLVGVLFYFLKTPAAAYLAARSTQIRQDLVTAAEMRAAATEQLAQIEAKLKSLPAELDALRARGAEDVVAERDRIARAAAVERDRLLEHTRREIDMQLRMARRDLVEYAAQLAVDVARARIVQSITPDDQLRLVDRYAAQLKEAR